MPCTLKQGALSSRQEASIKGSVVSVQLHWLCWQPTPYNDYLFQHLACADDLALEVHYRERMVASHPWRSALGQGYRARFYRKGLSLDWRLLGLAIGHRSALFVVGGWDHPTSVAMLSVMRILRRRYVLWSDTPNLDRKRSAMLAAARATWLRWVFAGARAVMGTGTPAVETLRKMGAHDERLVSFPYWVDLGLYARKSATCDRGPETVLRIVSVGRINNRLKGLDVALRALAQAGAARWIEFEYRVVGDGEDMEENVRIAAQLGLSDHVHFLGYIRVSQRA